MAPEISVDNEEIRTTREIARELISTLELLERGDLEKVVITQKGRMIGVILSVEEFSKLDANRPISSKNR